MKPAQAKKPTNQKPQYNIQRVGSGYSVFQDGQKITEENVWPITVNALARLLRKDNEI
jgi:hypothetical protein